MVQEKFSWPDPGSNGPRYVSGKFVWDYDGHKLVKDRVAENSSPWIFRKLPFSMTFKSSTLQAYFDHL